jgi:hypothetical protein
MTLFYIHCIFLYMIQAGIDIIHFCCMDVVGWSEVGLKVKCCGFICVLRSKSVEDPVSPTGLETKPHTSETLTALYLNVRQSKLGTIIIQTVNILQHDSAVTGSLSDGKFLHGQTNVLSGRSTIAPLYITIGVDDMVVQPELKMSSRKTPLSHFDWTKPSQKSLSHCKCFMLLS